MNFTCEKHKYFTKNEVGVLILEALVKDNDFVRLNNADKIRYLSTRCNVKHVFGI